MFEALDPAGRQVSEDDEPAVEGRKSQHDVPNTGDCDSLWVHCFH